MYIFIIYNDFFKHKKGFRCKICIWFLKDDLADNKIYIIKNNCVIEILQLIPGFIINIF